MATSSITKNFIIDSDQVETFVNALEASANDKAPRVRVKLTHLQGADQILKFMQRRNKANEVR